MNNYSSSFKIEEALTGVILFSLPISYGLNSLAIAVTTIFFLYRTFKKRDFKNLIIYYTSFGFFLAQFFSYIFSDNKAVASVKLLLYLPFLLIPISFSYLSINKITLNTNKIFKYLFYGTLVILVYGSFRFLYDVIFVGERYDYGRAVTLLLKYIPHHVYMSMFILISIYAILVGQIDFGENKKSLFFTPFLYLFLILLGSRMAILLGVFVLPIFLFKRLKGKKEFKRLSLFGGVFSLIILIIGLSNDFVLDKIIYSYYDLLSIPTKEKPFLGVSYRKQVWSSAVDLIYQSPFWGYGVGDVQEALNNSYKISDIKGLNAHNQYFQFILNYGIFICLILFFLIFKVIKQCVINKQNVLFFSWLILLFFCLSESILNRQWGVVLFAFILNFSIYSQNKSLTINE
jgi:O-antigen ligase